MPNGPAKHPRLVASLLLTACVAVIGLVLLNSGALAPSSYDSLHQLSPGKAGALTNSPVVLVYLDLNSFNVLTQDPTRPWPRRLHAQLLRKLTAAGARAVVFDVVFSAPSDDAAADDDLAAALRESGHAILAGESSRQDQPPNQRGTGLGARLDHFPAVPLVRHQRIGLGHRLAHYR